MPRHILCNCSVRDKKFNNEIDNKVSDFAKTKGWFFGHFADDPLLQSDDVEVAWQDTANKKISPQDKHLHTKSVEINIVVSGKIDLTMAAYAEYLAEYPADVVIDALRWWARVEKWWPAWSELKELLDRRVIRRKALRKALLAESRKPYPGPFGRTAP